MKRSKMPITANLFMIMLSMNSLAYADADQASGMPFHPAMNFQTGGLMVGLYMLPGFHHNQRQNNNGNICRSVNDQIIRNPE